jgi:3-methyladenine DNA glycosylase AlkC
MRDFERRRQALLPAANHVDDIAKIDPDLAVDILQRWRDSRGQRPTEIDYIVRHAIRTLIKQNNPRAMDLL